MYRYFYKRGGYVSQIIRNQTYNDAIFDIFEMRFKQS